MWIFLSIFIFSLVKLVTEFDFYWLWHLAFSFLPIVFYCKNVEYSSTDKNYIKCIKKLAYFKIVLNRSFFFSLPLSLDICCLLSICTYFSDIFSLSFILYSHLVIFNLAFFSSWFSKACKNAGNMQMRSGRRVLRYPATQRDTK